MSDPEAYELLSDAIDELECSHPMVVEILFAAMGGILQSSQGHPEDLESMRHAIRRELAACVKRMDERRISRARVN